MRYAFANVLYRIRFPRGRISATDFRPHFDGHLLNVLAPIPSGLSAEAIEVALRDRLQQSFSWMRVVRFLRPGDKVQLCLGTLKPRFQMMKAWTTRDELAAGIVPLEVAEYWR